MIRKEMELIKIFSIPGRIRLKAKGLKSNKSLAVKLEYDLSRIPFVQAVKANEKTGNILVLYDKTRLKEVLLMEALQNGYGKGQEDTGCEKPEIRPKAPKCYKKSLYQEELSAVKRILSISALAVFLRWLLASPVRGGAVLLLGFPFVFFLTVCLFLKYTVSALKDRRIHVDKWNTVRELQSVKRVILHPDAVFMNGNYKHMSYAEIESEVALGGFKDPVRKEARSSVRELRNLGILDLSLLNTGENSGLIQYGNRSLGLNASAGSEGSEILVLGRHVGRDEINGLILNQRIIAAVSDSFPDPPVRIQCPEMTGIPWMLRFCRRSGEYLTRSQIANIGIHIIAVMLALLEYVHFSFLFLIYGADALWSAFYLKHNIQNYGKEEIHGRQREFICP